MAAKSSPKKWTDVQMAIAAISMTTVLGLWNMFAGPDRVKAAEKSALDQANKEVPTPTEIVIATPEPTMPPAGYTILFGGEAPKPRVIIQQVASGGGGGDEGDGGDGGGGGGAVTSTSSS